MDSKLATFVLRKEQDFLSQRDRCTETDDKGVQTRNFEARSVPAADGYSLDEQEEADAIRSHGASRET